MKWAASHSTLRGRAWRAAQLLSPWPGRSSELGVGNGDLTLYLASAWDPGGRAEEAGWLEFFKAAEG